MWQHTLGEAKEISQDLDQEHINKVFSEMVMECMGYTGCGKENEAKILTMWKNGAQCLEDYNYSNSFSTPERIQDTKLMCPRNKLRIVASYFIINIDINELNLVQHKLKVRN